LHGKKASKGVFITTSKYWSEARSYISSIEPRVILIDGDLLVQFMVKFNVGVEPVVAYEVKKVDLDYFEEE
jgi:restriction system protein